LGHEIKTTKTIAMCGVLGLAGCSTPRVSVECVSQPPSDIVISLQKNRRVNGFLSLRVWQQNADRYLWVVNLNYFPTNRLLYGVLPERGPYHYTVQTYPTPPEKPSSPRLGTPFFVATEFQFDSAWPRAACAADAVFKFRIEKDGTITSLGTVKYAGDVFEKVNEPRSEWPQQAPGTLR
jgi:hypothetical protein